MLKYKFKYVLIGASGVGKSSIVNKFVYNKFDYKHESTIGIDFSVKNI